MFDEFFLNCMVANFYPSKFYLSLIIPLKAGIGFICSWKYIFHVR